jgi:hypothetical protein
MPDLVRSMVSKDYFEVIEAVAMVRLSCQPYSHKLYPFYY